MEEKLLLETGWLEIDSSDLFIRGGASSLWSEIFAKARSLINFIADYIPKLVKGFLEGFAVKIF